jgi:hypothetical protein
MKTVLRFIVIAVEQPNGSYRVYPQRGLANETTLNEIPGVAAIVTQDGYQVNSLWPLHHIIP